MQSAHVVPNRNTGIPIHHPHHQKNYGAPILPLRPIADITLGIQGPRFPVQTALHLFPGPVQGHVSKLTVSELGGEGALRVHPVGLRLGQEGAQVGGNRGGPGAQRVPLGRSWNAAPFGGGRPDMQELVLGGRHTEVPSEPLLLIYWVTSGRLLNLSEPSLLCKTGIMPIITSSVLWQERMEAWQRKVQSLACTQCWVFKNESGTDCGPRAISASTSWHCLQEDLSS